MVKRLCCISILKLVDTDVTANSYCWWFHKLSIKVLVLKWSHYIMKAWTAAWDDSVVAFIFQQFPLMLQHQARRLDFILSHIFNWALSLPIPSPSLPYKILTKGSQSPTSGSAFNEANWRQQYAIILLIKKYYITIPMDFFADEIPHST